MLTAAVAISTGVPLTNTLTGAITAAAFVAERYFNRVQVYERRESAGGTWSVTKLANR